MNKRHKYNQNLFIENIQIFFNNFVFIISCFDKFVKGKESDKNDKQNKNPSQEIILQNLTTESHAKPSHKKTKKKPMTTAIGANQHAKINL